MLNKDFKEINEKILKHYKNASGLGNSEFLNFKNWCLFEKKIELHWYQNIMAASIFNEWKVAWRCGRQIGTTFLLKLLAEYLSSNFKSVGMVFTHALHRDNFVKEMHHPYLYAFDIHNFLDKTRGHNFDYLFFDDVSWHDKLVDLNKSPFMDNKYVKIIMTGTTTGNPVFDSFRKKNKEYYFPSYVNPNYTKEYDNTWKNGLDKQEYCREVQARYYEEPWIEGLYTNE